MQTNDAQIRYKAFSGNIQQATKKLNQAIDDGLIPVEVKPLLINTRQDTTTQLCYIVAYKEVFDSIRQQRIELECNIE